MLVLGESVEFLPKDKVERNLNVNVNVNVAIERTNIHVLFT